MFTDPIADMLTRIRNAMSVGKDEVRVPYSRMKFKIAKLLEESGYIHVAEKTPESISEIIIKLRYKGKQSVIHNLKRVSTPGKRVYVKKDTLPHVLGGLGIAIVSTSQGIMTNKEAKKRSLGGEVLCEVY